VQQGTSPSHTKHHELTIKTPRLLTRISKNPQQKHLSTTSKKNTIQPASPEGNHMLRTLSTLVITTALATASHAQSDTLKLNQIQVIGTHNSYHAGIAPSESKLWQTNYAEAFKGLDYQHQPLPQQFDSGVRQIELDVYADAKGGRYAHPSGPKNVATAGLPADPDFDPNGIMNKPGFKVMHVQDVDYRSTCQPFTDWLAAIPSMPRPLAMSNEQRMKKCGAGRSVIDDVSFVPRAVSSRGI
jgi:hypothetical protein